MNERAKRIIAASDAKLIGHGGMEIIHQASGLCRKTIYTGIKDLTSVPLSNRCRKPGGGRKKLTVIDPTLIHALNTLAAPVTRGDPMSPLRWVSISTRHLAKALAGKQHPVSHMSAWKLLQTAGYTLQSNVKSKEEQGGKSLKKEEPDKQFHYTADTAREFLTKGNPVIPVDTGKKEIVGEYKNSGREWLPKGKPGRVNVHDFPDPALGKAIPYGVYDLTYNLGYVTVGITHDTSEFAVEAIRNRWNNLGRKQYKRKKELLITPDAGGSNGYRVRLWKKQLQAFSDETGLTITVCHFPGGTSKWNKIGHKPFSFITANWKGIPLESYEIIVNLIAATTAATGLKVYASLDTKEYRTKLEVTNDEMAQLNLYRHAFHPEPNYTITPGSDDKNSM